MILQRLRVENFKRFREADINFPSVGIIGVVGTNGAGKSTLFEAILWVLFRPNAIGVDNRDVVPRRSVGTTTKVELTIETDDAVYTIMRSLRLTKGGSQQADASVFRGDDQNPIVTGANPVSDFIRNTLLRMTPTSFTTTYFTRQKELAFFGSMGDTDRRLEMQRLLDLDAVERAQRQVRDRKNREIHVLEARTGHLESEMRDRDIDADVQTARDAEATAQQAVDTLADAVTVLTTTYETAAAGLTLLRQTERQHTDLGTERRGAQAALEAARATMTDARHRLEMLQERAERQSAIVPELSRLPDLEAALIDANHAAEHATRVANLTRDLRESEAVAARLNTETTALMSDLDALRDLLFDWDTLDEEPPGIARARMLTAKLSAAAPLAISRVTERNEMTALMRLAEDAKRARDEAKARSNKRAEIEARMAVVMAAGDPTAAVESLERHERRLSDEASRLETELTLRRAEHKKFATLMERWQNAEPDADCPTCGRPFSEEDADTILSSLQRSIEACTADGRHVGARLETVRAEGRDVNGRLQRERERLHETQAFVAQRDRSVIDERESHERAEGADARLREQVQAVGRRTPPTERDIAALEAEITLLQRAANSVKQSNRLVTEMEATEAHRARQRTALVALGPATYDAANHDALRREQARLLSLQAEAARIAEELRAVPKEEERLHAATQQATSHEATMLRAEREQAALAYDPQALKAASERVDAVAEEANAAQARLADARVVYANAVNTLQHAEVAQTQLAALRAEVDRLAASVHQYEMMDKEFTAFSMALAARIQPRLGEYASELIERMSNGRYHRLGFDTNYTPALYDGDLEKFPVDKFSGGERDIAALAARIALSQLLAARGGHTIGFMVLDEVFGSLDAERRTLVLDALGAMRDIIPQLFIISHVDDVRLSPMMDEVWTVAAQPDGTSEVLRRDAADVLLGASIAAM